MKKTLIALALAALPVASMADVVLYGQIKGGVEVSKTKGVSGTTTNIADYGSRIGFKGEEQLNGSLKAIWQLEQRVDIAGGANNPQSTARTFGTRDSFVGLTSDFGTVKAGYFHTPVSAVNGDLDQWEYSGDAVGLAGFTRSTAAAGRYVAVQYETPNMGGLTAKAYVSPSDNNTTTGEESSKYGVGVKFAQDQGFFADAAAVLVKKSYGEKDAYQALAQAGYSTDAFLAGVAYQYSNRLAAPFEATTTAKGSEVVLSLAANLDQALRLKGSAAFGFNFRDADGVSGKLYGNGKYYQGIVGADYALSKRTVANAQVGYLKYGKAEDKTRTYSLSVGLAHRF